MVEGIVINSVDGKFREIFHSKVSIWKEAECKDET
jgi:hypothetical protein